MLNLLGKIQSLFLCKEKDYLDLLCKCYAYSVCLLTSASFYGFAKSIFCSYLITWSKSHLLYVMYPKKHVFFCLSFEEDISSISVAMQKYNVSYLILQFQSLFFSVEQDEYFLCPSGNFSFNFSILIKLSKVSESSVNSFCCW